MNSTSRRVTVVADPGSDPPRVLPFRPPTTPPNSRTDHALLLFRQALERLNAGVPGAVEEADRAHSEAVEAFSSLPDEVADLSRQWLDRMLVTAKGAAIRRLEWRV